MEPTEPAHFFNRFMQWLKDSITIKLASIGFLTLLLLIPAAWIEQVIQERQMRAESVMEEVAEKWSGPQTLTGPIWVVPYRHRERIMLDRDRFEEKETIRKAFFLPEALVIQGGVAPEKLHRGIFDAVVYESRLSLQADFGIPDFARMEISPDRVVWADAYITMGISDLRGIHQQAPLVTVGGRPLDSEPTQDTGLSARHSENNDYPHTGAGSATGIVVPKALEPGSVLPSVEVQLNLRGSSRLGFVPSARTTTVTMQGPWADPSFDGQFLPDTRTVSDKDFSATWNILHYNRPLAQQWTETRQNIQGLEFGLTLLLPVDQYQKSMRSAKYGILVVLLTFVALVLVEITQKIRIHPFQYILMGASLIVYYLLLLSFSEQIGFVAAYGVSTAMTVTLVAAYSATFLNSRKLIGLLAGLLLLFYGFVLTIILLQDFALLTGSLGLFAIMAVLMFVSRRVRWYA